MKLISNFSKLSLPRVLRVLDKSYATGVLLANTLSENTLELNNAIHQIWLEEGHVVAVRQEKYHQDLYEIAVREGWMTPLLAERLRSKAPKTLPAGTYLESNKVVSFEQLRSLFFSEVVHRIEKLCTINNTKFCFQTVTDLPMHEMTGFRMPAEKVTKYGLQIDCCSFLKERYGGKNSRTKLLAN